MRLGADREPMDALSDDPDEIATVDGHGGTRRIMRIVARGLALPPNSQTNRPRHAHQFAAENHSPIVFRLIHSSRNRPIRTVVGTLSNSAMIARMPSLRQKGKIRSSVRLISEEG